MKHRICTAAACICLLLMMALPAFAAEYGEPDITPQTTMGEIRSNPSILGAGVWTYSKEQNLPGTEDWCNDQTLEKYVSSHVAQDCADGLNLLVRNYNAGVQITYSSTRSRRSPRTAPATMGSSITTRPARRMQSMRWCSPATSSTARQS